MFTQRLIKDVLKLKNNFNDHYGVEIELEFEEEPNLDGVPKEWGIEGDGSLRRHGYEFVLRVPLTLDKAKDAVTELLTHLKKNNTILDNGRAGVHVHCNVGNLTVCQTASLLGLAFVHEPLLEEFCGEWRKGNLFCLSSERAEYVIDLLKDALVWEDLNILGTDKVRYAFINMKAMRQYGSIEFRGMRSDGDAEAICTWLSLIDKLKQKAKQIDNPCQIVTEISVQTPEVYLKELFGEYTKHLPLKDGWEFSLMRAVRRVQTFAYCKEW